MSEIIREYIKKTYMSQNAFAEKVGISRQLLHWHLSDHKRKWSAENAKKIVEAMNDGEFNWKQFWELTRRNN